MYRIKLNSLLLLLCFLYSNHFVFAQRQSWAVKDEVNSTLLMLCEGLSMHRSKIGVQRHLVPMDGKLISEGMLGHFGTGNQQFTLAPAQMGLNLPGNQPIVFGLTAQKRFYSTIVMPLK